MKVINYIALTLVIIVRYDKFLIFKNLCSR